MHSQTTEPLITRHQPEKRPVDRVIRHHEELKIEIGTQRKEMVLCLVVSIATSVLLHAFYFFLFENSPFQAYLLLYVPYLLWIHIVSRHREYYTDPVNLDLHYLTSTKIKTYYFCLSAEPSHLYFVLQLVALLLLTVCHIFYIKNGNSLLTLLLLTDILWVYMSVKKWSKVKKARQKLINYLNELESSQIYTIIPMKGEQRAQIFQQFHPQQFYFQPRAQSQTSTPTPPKTNKSIELQSITSLQNISELN